MYCQRHVKNIKQSNIYIYVIKDSKGEVGDNLLGKFIEKNDRKISNLMKNNPQIQEAL